MALSLPVGTYRELQCPDALVEAVTDEKMVPTTMCSSGSRCSALLANRLFRWGCFLGLQNKVLHTEQQNRVISSYRRWEAREGVWAGPELSKVLREHVTFFFFRFLLYFMYMSV